MGGRCKEHLPVPEPKQNHKYVYYYCHYRSIFYFILALVHVETATKELLTEIVWLMLHVPSCPSCLRDHLICMELWPSDKHRLAYTTSLLLFQYCLPLLLVLLCYLRIFLRLRRRRSTQLHSPSLLTAQAFAIHCATACLCS